MWKAKIYVTLRAGIHDPQGQAVESSLLALGFKNISNMRVGKFLEVTLEAVSEEIAKDTIRAMCDRLLANPVMEDYTFIIEVEK
ncbi:MAG: phosphoribosylformylglycinamidine synthase subunit PurS [bacterium]|nr:phosphoribosylformylglycinamidine synthase subunit PurS [bacterium]